MSSERDGFLTRWRHWIGALVIALAVAWSSAARIRVALNDKEFRGASAPQLLRTDPAFLFYVTERIVESGGAAPSDLRADPNVEWPEQTDLAAIETLGQEFVVAWSYLAAQKPMQLHLWAVWVMGVWASLVAVGVYGMAYELTLRVRWASAAVVLWAAMLVDYRTIGFVLIREDFAFPWLAAHLWLALRAARTKTPLSFVLAGATLLAAAAFWHAAMFVLAIEALAVFAWFLRTARTPFEPRGSWLVLATALLGSLAVPVLRAKHFALSPPMLLGCALWYVAWMARGRSWSRATALAHALGAACVLLAISKLASHALGGGVGDYGHVFSLLLAKLKHLGAMPSDPSELDFGARLLWQGPFQTADIRTFTQLAAAGTLALAASSIWAVPAWLRGQADARLAIAWCFTCFAALATWLVERTAPMFGFASAALAAVVLARLNPVALSAAIATLACLGHVAHQIRVHATQQLAWYHWEILPPSGRETAHALRWIHDNVPRGEAVAADYSTSAAVLAFTRRPVLTQPKYETLRSRQRIEDFCNAFYAGTPSELADYLRSQKSRWLLINRPFLMGNATELGGITREMLPAISQRACFQMMEADPRLYSRVEGFTLVYETPRELRGGSYRIYRLD